MLSIYPSWYPDKEYSQGVENYFKAIETVFKVQIAYGTWEHIHLTSHQRQFHADDITVTQDKAQYKLVDKSRNTSFTVSSIITLATGNYYFRDETVPLVRINETKVKELIAEAKKIIKHMTPIILDNGDYFPFNPELVEYNALSITFPDRGVVWQGYPALSPDAAEIIRGNRTTRGLIDEANYIRFFKAVYTAMRDSKRGASIDSGKGYHQIIIGSTLKGFTPYYYWREGILNKIKNKKIDNFKHYKWEIFNPEIFDIDNPLKNYDSLIPIVPWHSKKTIKNIMQEDWETFLEEYMAILTPDETQLYNVAKIMELATSKEKDLNSCETGKYYGGVDPSGEGMHYFAISIFEVNEKGIKKQIFLNQKQKVDLDEREAFIRKLLDNIPFTKFRIDGNGLGYHMAQSLIRDYPEIVEVLRGNIRVKAGGKNTIGINEYLHTNQKIMINKKTVRYLDDEKQYKQFAGWNRLYKADENKEVGHCDSTVSNGLALLPDNWRIAGRGFEIKTSTNKEEEDYFEETIKQEPETTPQKTKEIVKDFNNNSMSNRMKFYKSNKRK